MYSKFILSLAICSTCTLCALASDGEDDFNISDSTQKQHLSEVNVTANKLDRENLTILSRLPLSPQEQIQSITIVPEEVITKQGALTISEAAKNASGVYTFSTYGNVRESMSMRGFRGVPLLKNGVRINSDFRGTGILTDMQGIESIQVLKGAAALTQGVATDIGSPGGVINLMTKTPQFINAAKASLRLGSWGQVRPTFDVQSILDKEGTIAFRLNGAYERANSYRPVVGLEKIYINPSIEWRPTNKTIITAEMDYLNDTRTPDPGTINLANYDSNAIIDLPYNKFGGFKENKSINIGTTYAGRITHFITDKIFVRAAYFGSNLKVNATTTSYGTGGGRTGLPSVKDSKRYRSIGSSNREDINSVLQFDLVGKDLYTGDIAHTFMAGFDYRRTNLSTQNGSMASGTYIDLIDFNNDISNNLPSYALKYIPTTKDSAGNILTPATTEEVPIKLNLDNKVSSLENSFGILAQNSMNYKDIIKLRLGIRYSSNMSNGSAAPEVYTTGSAIDPQLGIIITPVKNINLFGSYTSSTSIRGAANLDTLGNELGNQKINQIEAGIKSTWFNNRLWANITFYKINNKNMSLPVYDVNWNETGFYMKGGNDQRTGVEIDINGRITNNLMIMAGYAYINAQYKEHVSYKEGSAPLNTPNHTANFWANYRVNEGSLSGLNFGLGAFYTGKRPVNDWATSVTHSGIVPGLKPFDIEAITTVNAQIGYNYKQYGVRLFANNIFNKIGYNAYRTSFINQTDPRNFAVALTYDFR